MKHFDVNHQTGKYTVTVSDSALGTPLLTELIGARPAMIVSDENVAPLWLEQVRHLLPAAATLVLPAGEAAKTLAHVADIWSTLAARGFGRDTVLVALGGGVIGDMTGFAAACWMRGIDFIQVPTTLLAQVDASIGGKTGIDLPAGKNLVGAFHPPHAVVIDTRTLSTLPDREFASGLAEVVKAALLADTAFLDWLEAHADGLVRREPDLLIHAIHQSGEIKARIVMEDERERGVRAVLNLGHTFAHALETVTGYTRFLHGEAVSIGLVLASVLSETQCGLDRGVRARLIQLLESFGLPVRLPPSLDHQEILAAMQMDKKHTHTHWQLVLLESPATPRICRFTDNQAILQALQAAGG